MPKAGTKSPVVAIKFTCKGIIGVHENGYKERIGDPIRVKALGTGIQDGAAYTVLQFRDRDRKWRTLAFRSSLLTARINDFKAELADQHYRWPTQKLVGFIIDRLAAMNPVERTAITLVPGWQGSRYVRPDGVIKPNGDDWDCVLADFPNVRLPEVRINGRLEEWRREVARWCSLSSRLRLAVGTAFAAPVLRRVNVDTFGFHFVGDSSSGKTLCLRVACSVPGFNSNAGPTTWDGSSPGIEELALGTRDNITSLDDTDAIEGDIRKKRGFVRLTFFKLSTNRPRLRAGHYARQHVVKSDLRNVILSTGEDILIEGGRLRGQDVRMIHILAGPSEFDDIFDSERASEFIGASIDSREEFVNSLEARTRKFQGVAQRLFLLKLVDDNTANKALARYMDEFISCSPLPQSRRLFARLRRRFAVVYAGSALAIDYKILPFQKNATLRDIRKCMHDAMDLLIELESAAVDVAAPHLSDDQLVAEFRDHICKAKFMKVGRYRKNRQALSDAQIQQAFGFINFVAPDECRAMLRSTCLKRWFPEFAVRNRLVRLLRARRILMEGRAADVSTQHLMINHRKIPCYCIKLLNLQIAPRQIQFVIGSD